MPNWLQKASAITLFACFVTGFAITVWHASRQDQNRNERRPPQDRASASQANNPGPWAPFKVLFGNLESVSSYCNSIPEDETKRWPQTYYCDLRITDVYVAVFTLLTALITLGLIVVGVRQEVWTKRHERAYIYGGIGDNREVKEGNIIVCSDTDQFYDGQLRQDSGFHKIYSSWNLFAKQHSRRPRLRTHISNFRSIFPRDENDRRAGNRSLRYNSSERQACGVPACRL